MAVKSGKPRKNNERSNFWQNLPKPFFVLAPMANVTDSVFRKLIAKYGKPDVMWTEFVSADGLVSPGRKNLLHDLVFSEKERPIVAQLFTGHPEVMKKAAKLIAELGFDGLDINMGCPDRQVEKQGGGAGMIKSPKSALEVIAAAREGVESQKSIKSIKSKSIPVTVKTRLGYNKIDWEWLRLILGQKLPALTIHLRTRKEMSDVPAHWELMPEIIKLRNEITPETLIIGNGDVESVEKGRELLTKYGGDGVMIGRGIFGKPWLFGEGKGLRVKGIVYGAQSLESRKNVPSSPFTLNPSPSVRLQVLLEHTKLFEKTFVSSRKGKGIKNFAVMRKHFKAYVNGWDGAKELRARLMETNSAKEVAAIVKSLQTTGVYSRHSHNS